MAGAGTYGAGIGPAGHLPVASTRLPLEPQPVALRYEGQTSDWALTTDGTRYRRVHFVDQGFALGMCIDQGSLKSSPTTGNTLRRVKNLGAKNLGDQVEKAVRSANPIARYVADGSATIVRIEYTVEPHGRFLVTCVYRNNLLGANAPDQRAVYES